jgi:hypothetical protein
MSVIIAKLPVDDSEVRVSLEEFKGVPIVDIRWHEPFTAARALTATKRGIGVPVEQLPDLTAALAEAVRRARELGLIGGDA